MHKILECKELRKSFEGTKAVNNVSFGIEKGNIVSLIGPNGAGKTSLFNLITGYIKLDYGAIYFKGEKISDNSPHSIARNGIARTFQELRLIKRLTAHENISLAFHNQKGEGVLGALLGNSKIYEERQVLRAKKILEFVGIPETEDCLAGELSYGQQKLLTIGCCYAQDSDLLLLDEPVSGVSPWMIKQIFNLLKDLQRKGTTIFLIEHNMDLVTQISNRVVAMNEGKITAEGTPKELLRNADVFESYLT